MGDIYVPTKKALCYVVVTRATLECYERAHRHATHSAFTKSSASDRLARCYLGEHKDGNSEYFLCATQRDFWDVFNGLKQVKRDLELNVLAATDKIPFPLWHEGYDSCVFLPVSSSKHLKTRLKRAHKR